ncbi:hypothetical protein [Klenkia soli]|uniref:hypothetical protein n=1 Tax=Klenkia soli TaxID=1052260 RepID=UPI001041FAE6|nr:hypothetical protein [Klenkia soli]
MDDWRELLPTAYLLAGSDTGARDLLARGLARGGGLEGLVRAHLRRRLARDTSIAGTSGDPWWLSTDDVATAGRTAAALDGLPRADRTAAVLRWHEGLHADRVAALVPGVDLAALPDRLGIPAAELPRRLEGLAALADLRDLTDDDVAAGVRAVRTRRRSRVLLAVGAVAVLGAGAVWLPDALPAPAPAAADNRSVAPDAPVSGPARGSLADDPEFVAGLRDALDPGLDDARLLYAGDAAGLRWALLVLPDGDGVTTSWFVGPEGADPADLLRTGDAFAADPPAAWSLLATIDGRTAVLLVAEPGDQVELSDGFVVAADGTAGRDFAPLDLDDGVAALPLAGARTGSAVVFRLSRDGGPAGTGSPSSISNSDLTVVDPPPARSGSAPVDATAFEFALAEITRPTGVDLADLDVTVLGSGTFPAPGGTTAHAVTVAAVLPGGAVATSTATSYDDGSGAPCGTQTLPAGTDPATATVVTRCASYAGDSSTFGATVVVAAPLGVAVTLNSAAGGDPVVPDLVDGWGYVLGDGLTQYAADGVPGEVSRAGTGPFD